MSQQKHIHIHVFSKTDLHLTELLSNTYSSVQNKFTCSYSMAVLRDTALSRAPNNIAHHFTFKI